MQFDLVAVVGTECIVNRHRSVRIRSRVDNDAVYAVNGALNPFDQLAFVVRLSKIDVQAHF